MLKISDFEKVKLFSTSELVGAGGGWTSTKGGHKQVLMQSFDYGCDSTNGQGTMRYHDITNSTFNDGSGAHDWEC